MFRPLIFIKDLQTENHVWKMVFVASLKGRSKKKLRFLIWAAVCKLIWLIRNATLFKGGHKRDSEIVLLAFLRHVQI